MEEQNKQFIERANLLHCNKYDYSKVNYINSQTKVCIICPKHGEFWQRPIDHMNGNGCPHCAVEGRKLSKENFISKSKELYGDIYDFDETVIKGYDDDIKVKCKKHGYFVTTPHIFLNKKRFIGCPICAKEKKIEKSIEYFRQKSIEIHGNKYLYDFSEFKNNKSKISIFCKKHGWFKQSMNAHISKKQGCPICAGTCQKTTEQFINEANVVHGGKYDYAQTVYKNNRTNVKVICPLHGEFSVKPDNHLAGNGCPKCAGKHRTTEELIRMFEKVHGDVYDYSKVVFTNSCNKVDIICKKHGVFEQNIYSHLNGCGCPKCMNTISNGETEIEEYCKKLIGKENVITKEHCILEGRELDIYIPSKKIAIEYDGLIWHSEKFGKDANYHLKKTEECKKKNIRLIHIFEDEYLTKRELVLAKLKHILGCDNNSRVIGGRKCILKEITFPEANEFLNKFHLQGGVPSSVYLGGFFDGELIAVMTFKKIKGNEWELTRFATNINYRIPGIANRLFSFFKKKTKPSYVKSFLDRRWNLEGNTLYEKMGFKLDKIEKPDYAYVKGGKYGMRIHKFSFRKQILHKKYNLPLTMTEKEMTHYLGFYRIWNCGLAKYVYSAQ